MGILNRIGETLWGTSGEDAAKKQLAAQNENFQRQKGLWNENRSDIESSYGGARDAITGYGNQSIGSLSRAYGEQQGLYGRAGEALGQGGQSALSSLASGYGQARQDLGAVDTRSALGSNFEQDPGYQFRLQQGEQALGRAQSAMGGRASGGALKKLAEFNSGLASQEFGAAANRDAQLRAMQMQQGQNLGSFAMGYGQSQAGQQNLNAGNMANLYGQQAGAAQQYGQNQAGVYGNMGGALSGLYQNQVGANLQNSGLLSGAYNTYAQYPGMVEQQRASGDLVNTASGLLGAWLGG